MALAIFVLAITHDNVLDLGVVMAMVYAPSILLGWTVAGVIDRFNKRWTLLTADLARAVMVASIPVVHRYLWTVVAVFIMYSFAMVYRPMVRGVQPQIAGSPAMNAKSGARQQTYYAVGDVAAYLAAALVLFVWGVAPAFWIDAATYVAATLVVLSIRVDPVLWQPVATGALRFMEQLRGGYRFLRRDGRVAQLTLLSASLALGVGALNTFTAPLSRNLWHVSSHHYVWLVLAMAVGSLISGSMLERYDLMHRWSFRVIIGAGLCLTGMGYALVVVMPFWWLGALSLVLVGLGNGAFGVGIMVWMQQSTPAEIRSRVLSIRGMGMGIGGALGAILGGWFAETLGLTGGVLATSALWMLLALWCMASRALAGSAEPNQAA